jgi:mannose-6-phosphate isomerase-like protein (cupin superfamily)
MNENVNVVGKTYVRPWGSYKTLEMGNGFQVKIITVNPGGQLSLQKHSKRAEHWVVVTGNPTITVGDKIKSYNVGDEVYIPMEAAHRMENQTQEPAAIVEVQIGSYLGEDDIVRLEDVYGRK